jgi:hypothetical protein
MGIFGKLIGKKAPEGEGATPVAPTQPAAAAPPILQAESRVAPRVRISPLHRIQFQCSEPQFAKFAQPIGVGNISSSGIAFIRSALPQWPGPTEQVGGLLLIGSHQLGIRARIIHLSTALVGCRFEGELASLQQAIDEYFKLELTAIQARPMNPSILKKDPRGTPHWFMAENNSELYYIENAGRVVHFHLSVFGNYIDGGEGKPTTYGHEQPDRDGAELIKSSVLIHTTTDLPKDVVMGALRFLEGIDKVPREVRDQIVKKVSDPFFTPPA